MEIKIEIGKNDFVWLRGGDASYELCEMRNTRKEKGGEPEPTLVPYKYYTSLSQAISCLLDMKVRASEATTLEELRITIKKAKEELAGMYEVAA